MSRGSSVIDLTSASGHQLFSESITVPPSSSRNRPRVDRGSPGLTPRGVKRRRQDDISTGSETSDAQFHENIESIDLTGIDGSSALAKTVAKQREDAIKAQKPAQPDESQSILSAYKCPICMDTPEDATSTACGHLFCHRCIVDYLSHADEQRFDSSKLHRGTCPVCRKPITRNESSGPRRSLIPLQIKLTTKKRRHTSPVEA